MNLQMASRGNEPQRKQQAPPSQPQQTQKMNENTKQSQHENMIDDGMQRRDSQQSQGSIILPLVDPFKRSKFDNRSDSMKYIFVTGSMLSNSGKSTTMASIGKKLQDLGHRVTAIKIDNYLNVDCGLLAPDKFGEIFVFNDGTECHYDCGIYERYLNIELTWQHHLTLGKILEYVNVNERNGKFFGNVITLKNEQIIDTICQWIWNVAHLPIKKFSMKNSASNSKNIPQIADVCIVDFGGNVEDDDNDLFLESMKHFQRYYVSNRETNYFHIHFGFIIEHALDSANNKRQSIIKQYSETAERCLKQALLGRRLIPSALILRFEGRESSGIDTSGHRYNDDRYGHGIYRGGKKIQLQDEIVQKFYNLLTLGHTSHKFITNKLKQSGRMLSSQKTTMNLIAALPRTTMHSINSNQSHELTIIGDDIYGTDFAAGAGVAAGSAGASKGNVSGNFNDNINDETSVNDGSHSPEMSLTYDYDEIASGGGNGVGGSGSGNNSKRKGGKPNIRSKIIELPNLDTTYAIPDYLLHNTQLFEVICSQFRWEIPDKNDATNANFWDIMASYTRGQAITPDKYFAGNIFQELAMKVRSIEREVTIGLVGKYGTDSLTYLSLIEALKLSALSVNVQLNVKVISSDDLELLQEKREYLTYTRETDVAKNHEAEASVYNDFAKTKFSFMNQFLNTDDSKENVGPDANGNLPVRKVEFNEQAYNAAWRDVYSVDGILVGGGFGSSGILGIISCIKYCRERDVPFFGICFGMQLACIEYARNVLGLSDANSSEINSKCDSKIVIQMPATKEMLKMGHTMRLGSCKVTIKKDTLAWDMYKPKSTNGIIFEKHRHGYEINPKYVDLLEKKGLNFSGKDLSNDTPRMEIVELDRSLWKNHSYFVACQFHPELVASVYNPGPLFNGLMQATKERKYGKIQVKPQSSRGDTSSKKLFRL